MSAPNPRTDAFRILRKVEAAGAFASTLLEKRAAKLRDSREAGLLTELVQGVLRHRAPLDHAIAAAATRPVTDIDPEALTALRIGAYSLLYLDRVPDFAAVDTAVALVKEAGAAKAAGFVNGVLRAIARRGTGILPPAPLSGDVRGLALFRSHPEWWTQRVVDRFGWDRADAMLAANNQPAATVLAASVDPAALALALGEEGVVAASCRFVPSALRVVSGVPQRTQLFKDGAFWIQDEASQLAVSLFGSAAGPMVLDACAAPGGKTLGLAARSQPGGLTVATDRHPKRLLRLVQNVARIRAGGVVTLAADMSKPGPFSCLFDDVLVDAPCSGTGTLRRHPEIRWRLTPDDLRVTTDRQRRILGASAALVRPGGRLVYSVCSIEPEEGEQIVEEFLARRTDFSRADPRPALPPAAHALVGDDHAVRTGAGDDGMDGFYAVLLTRPAVSM